MKLGLLLSAVLLFTSGCNDGSSESEGTNETASKSNGVAGLWFGETTTVPDFQKEISEPAEVVAIVTPDARFAYMTLSSKETVTADITIVGNDFSATSAHYYKYIAKEREGRLDVTLSDGVLSGEVSASGIPLQFKVTSIGSVNQADINLITGNYATDGVALAIDSDGILTGSNKNGCILSGSVEIIDPKFPIYNIVLNMEACMLSVDVEGVYKGIVAHGIFPYDNNELPGLVLVAEGPSPGESKLWGVFHHLIKG